MLKTFEQYHKQQPQVEIQHDKWLYCSNCLNGILEYKHLCFYIDEQGVYLEILKDIEQTVNSGNPNHYVGRNNSNGKDVINVLPNLPKYELVIKSKEGNDYHPFDSSRHSLAIQRPYLMCTHMGCNNVFGYYHVNPIKKVFSFRIDHTKSLIEWVEHPWKYYLNKIDIIDNFSVYIYTDNKYLGFNSLKIQSSQSQSQSSSPPTLKNNNNNTTNGNNPVTSSNGGTNYIPSNRASPKKLNELRELYYKPTIYPEEKPGIPKFKDGVTIEPRLYQIESYYQCTQRNTLLVLPTGMGKTLVSIMTILEMYRLNNQDNPDGETKRVALFLVDRVPLVTQQATAIEAVTTLKVCKLYGEINDHVQRNQVKSKQYDVLVSTVQSVVNLLEATQMNILDFYSITFDEVHHAGGSGQHPFNRVIEFIRMSDVKYWPRILGLTASLIGINNNNIESAQTSIKRMETIMLSNVFKPMSLIHDTTNTENEEILPELIEFKSTIQEYHFESSISSFLIEQCKFIQVELEYSDVDLESTKNHLFLKALERLAKRAHEIVPESSTSEKALNLIEVYNLLSVLNIEGPKQVISKFENILAIVDPDDDFYTSLLSLKYSISDQYSDVPSNLEKCSSRYKCLLKTLNSVIYKNGDGMTTATTTTTTTTAAAAAATINTNDDIPNLRIIVFVETRLGAANLIKMLKKEPFEEILNSKRLVGHNGYDGMDSDKQQAIIQKFRDGKCRLIVSTNVLEEGVDIQDCNLVICYDGILSLKSLIQRRGRARSKEQSKFIIIYNDSKDLKILEILSSENLLNNSINQILMKRESNEKINNHFLNWKKVNRIIDDIKKEKLKSVNKDHQYAMLSVYHIKDHHSFIDFLSKNHDPMFSVYHLELVAMKIDDDEYLSNFIMVTLICQDQQLAVEAFIKLVEFGNFSFWLLNKSKFYLDSSSDYTSNSNGNSSNGNGNGNGDDGDNSDIKSNTSNILNTLDIMDQQKYINSNQDNNKNNHSNQDKEESENVIKFQYSVSKFEYGNMLDPTTYFKIDELEDRFKLIFEENKLIIKSVGNEYRLTLKFSDMETSYLYFLEHTSGYYGDDELINLFFIVKRPLSFEERQQNSRNGRDHWNKAPPLKSNFGESFVYRVVLPKSINGECIESLCAPLVKNGFKMFQCIMNVLSSNYRPNLNFQLFSLSRNKDIQYLLYCLDSQRSFGRVIQQDFIASIENLLSNGRVEEAKFIIESLISKKTKFIDYRKYIEDCLMFFKHDRYFEKKNRLSTTSNEFSWIREVYQTPSRIVYIQPNLQRSNRVVRRFGANHFILAKFTDENLEPIQGVDKRHRVFDKIQSIFNRGVVICNENYSYVGNSNSQLRDYSAWLVNDRIGAEAVRKWTEISYVDNPRKFFRCMGLMFSTTIPTFRISPDCFYIIHDVERNNHCFTEGCGEIGFELAKHINEMFGFKPSTCAYQVRIGGAKGMLVVNDQLANPFGVYIRNSMIKFHTKDSDEHRTLEICSVSTTSRCKLNRQVISLLSTLGTKDSVFFSLQDRYLNQMANIVNDSSTSKQLISEFFPDITESELYQDTYIRRILITLYKLKMERIQQKCHIEIKNSRMLCGVADPTGTLPPNTVFVLLEGEDPDDGHKTVDVVVGLVMVIKNPCTHPGDVRYLEAKDNPQLRHLRNVLVFSTQGQVPNFKEISGSDLDGDRYFFCFDKDLIGSRRVSEEAYLGEDFEQKPNHYRDDEVDDIYRDPHLLSDMYFNNVERQYLGTMYNAHLAICDHFGATNEMAIAISKECFKEIDYAKTGVHGEIPAETKELLRIRGYPHYMKKENSTKHYYQSKTVMGILYDQIDQLVYIGDFLPTISVEKSKLVKGYEKYLEDALNLYNEYKIQIHSLLYRYRASSEESLMIGFFDQGFIEKVSMDVKNEMKSNYKKICQMFENEFLKEFGELHRETTLLIHKDNIEKKIAAWYYIAYNDKDPNRALGFYWIARTFKQLSQQDDTQKRRNIMINSILNHMETKRVELLPIYQKRLDVVQELNRFLRFSSDSVFQDSSFELIGSTATLMFEDTSNLNLYFKLSKTFGSPTQMEVDQKLDILNTLRDELKTSDLTLKNCIISVNKPLSSTEKVPLFKFTKNGIQVVIGLEESKWKETLIQQHYIYREPSLLSLLFCIMDWGVNSSFIPNESAIIHSVFSNASIKTTTSVNLNSTIASSPTNSLISLSKSNVFHLFIQFCLDTKLIQKFDEHAFANSTTLSTNLSNEIWKKLIDISSRYFSVENNSNGGNHNNNSNRNADLEQYNTTNLSDTILSFFRYYSDKFGGSIYENKSFKIQTFIPNNGTDQIIDPNIDNHKSTLLFYQESFRHALHSLSTFISIGDFLSNCFKTTKKVMEVKKSQFSIINDKRISNELILNVQKCGCSIIIDLKDKNKPFILITGKPQQLRLAQNLIRDVLSSSSTSTTKYISESDIGKTTTTTGTTSTTAAASAELTTNSSPTPGSNSSTPPFI